MTAPPSNWAKEQIEGWVCPIEIEIDGLIMALVRQSTIW